MQIIRDFSPADRPLALTVGNFDGVHLGHRHLIAQTCRRAAAAGHLAAAMTFEPHPLTVLRPDADFARLYSRREKMQLLRQCGVQALYMVRFNKALAAMPPDAFAELLFGRLQARCLLVGSNFRFGRGGQGDFSLLEKHAAAAGSQAVAVPLLEVNGSPVSSGKIRDCLAAGDFAAAAQLLGRAWQLAGTVQRGRARGREWGFPTANLALSYTPPLRGIFAARAECGGQCHAAAVSIGTNPTVDSSGRVRVEAHLLDFEGDLYHRRLRLQLLHKLRDEQKYDSIPALAAAIADDIARTRALTA